MIINPYSFAGGGATYADEVLADSPLAYWRLGESSGTTAVDEMATYSASYVASPTLGVTGAVSGDTAVTLNGSTQYMDAGDVLDMGTSDWTIECWVKTTANDWSAVAKSIAADIYGRYAIFYTGGVLYGLMFWATGTGVEFGWTSNTPKDGAWHHIALTFDRDGNATLYFDGSSVASTSIAAGSAVNMQSTDPLYLGAYGNATATGPLSGFVLNGSIDEVAIYNTALSSGRIAAHYAAA
jgi:Concanavalin A-like lectin/glucanases superfamily